MIDCGGCVGWGYIQVLCRRSCSNFYSCFRFVCRFFFANWVSASLVCTISSGGATFISRPIMSDVIKTVATTISNPIVASFHWLGEMSAIDILLFLKTLHFPLFYIDMTSATATS